MKKKLLNFQASISDIKQINPLFSTCKVQILYTGKNRNLSIIEKDAVEKALPSLVNVPIVGEYNQASSDFKGHGGAIDLDSWDFIHTTKPYGVVPESATYSWETIKGSDGTTREYLTVDGCILWTGRYEEAYSIIEKGKGQSMEIEVTDGAWDDVEDAYRIRNFLFSALCILGDDVTPAFEDAKITSSYSLSENSFEEEFQLMLSELKKFQIQDKGENQMFVKLLLEKYSTSIEELTAKGINFSEISEDELEAKIVEALGIQEEDSNEDGEPNGEGDSEPEGNTDGDGEPEGDTEDSTEPEGDANPEGDSEPEGDTEPKVDNAEIEALKVQIEELNAEVEELREFKLNIEKAEHEEKVNKLFANFQLTDEDVKELDIHSMKYEEIEEKCYAILGRKLASKKNFSLDNSSNKNIKLPLGTDTEESPKSRYGDLFEKYNK